MGLDFTPLFVMAFAGIGAMLGLMLIPLVALLAWFFPPLWPWLFAPVLAGAIIGIIFGVMLK